MKTESLTFSVTVERPSINDSAVIKRPPAE
jgi:hypothetical protein